MPTVFTSLFFAGFCPRVAEIAGFNYLFLKFIQGERQETCKFTNQRNVSPDTIFPSLQPSSPGTVRNTSSLSIIHTLVSL